MTELGLPVRLDDLLMIAVPVLAALAVLIAVVAVRHRSRRRRLPRRWTRHVEQRMRQRGIARADVERVLAAPSRTTRDRRERSVRLDARVGGRPLKVWVAEPWPPRDEIVLKSAAWGDVDG